MSHPDLDTKPSKWPFDRYPVCAVRIEQGTDFEDRFYLLEIDLPNDNLGPMTPPAPMSEAEVRARLAALGLSEAEVEERLTWAKRWMATRILKSDSASVLWLPPL